METDAFLILVLARTSRADGRLVGAGDRAARYLSGRRRALPWLRAGARRATGARWWPPSRASCWWPRPPACCRRAVAGAAGRRAGAAGRVLRPRGLVAVAAPATAAAPAPRGGASTLLAAGAGLGRAVLPPDRRRPASRVPVEGLPLVVVAGLPWRAPARFGRRASGSALAGRSPSSSCSTWVPTRPGPALRPGHRLALPGLGDGLLRDSLGTRGAAPPVARRRPGGRGAGPDAARVLRLTGRSPATAGRRSAALVALARRPRSAAGRPRPAPPGWRRPGPPGPRGPARPGAVRRAVADDPYVATPPDLLLRGCAARTCCWSSWRATAGSRSEGPRPRPASTRALDAGTQRLTGGLATRSAFLTSPTFGADQLARPLHPAVRALGGQPAPVRPAGGPRPVHATARSAGPAGGRSATSRPTPRTGRRAGVLPLGPAVRRPQRRVPRPAVRLRVDARPVHARARSSASS